MSLAVRTLSDKIFIETLDCQPIRNGNGWILNFLEKANVVAIVIDGASGQNLLAGDIKRLNIAPKPTLPKVQEVINANAMWEQAIYQKEICHNDQPSLTAVVTNCQKRNIGTQGGFGYKSIYDDRDISLMDSAILAAWACGEVKPTKKQKIRY